MALDPNLKIISPWKDPSFDLRDRESAVDYANKKAFPSIRARRRSTAAIAISGTSATRAADLESPANEPKDDLWMISVPVTKRPTSRST